MYTKHMTAWMRIGIFFFGMFLGGWLILAPFFGQMDADSGRKEVIIANQQIMTEVVKTPEELERGLGGRANIGMNEGMLFIFDALETRGFWMKDMRFPIDIVWIAGDKIVGFEENMDPQIGAQDFELKVYYPKEPVDKVLELKAGRVRMLRAQVGDTVKLRPIEK